MAEETREEVVKSKKGLVITVCVIVVVAIIALLLILSRNNLFGPNHLLNKYATSYIKQNSKKYCSTMPEEILKKNYEGKDKCIEIYDDIFKNAKDSLSKYEIKDKKELTGSDLELIKMDLSRDFGISSSSVKKAYKYQVTFSYKDKEEKVDVEVYVAKINKSWYLIKQITNQ